MRKLISYYSQWLLISTLVGVACGIASAIFLYSLDWATNTRNSHDWLFYLLPIGGVVIAYLYLKFGNHTERGNNLLIDEFHNPKSVVPFRMAPLVFFGTVITHLLGGSAGREGTAVQMGGSLADQIGRTFKIEPADRRKLLMAGMSGGFASVFGVPIAGTIFGLEVLTTGRLQLWAVIECLISAFVAHYVTLQLGVHHTVYPQIPPFEISPIALLNAVVAGVAFGLAARIFSKISHVITNVSKTRIPNAMIRAAIAGVVLSAIFLIAPTMQRFAGLGVPHILRAFHTPIATYDWLLKLLLTAFTLSMGFKGGEVTPLLFIGATLGNALNEITFLHFILPVRMLAAMGLVAVFAGAANTPIACIFMAYELFGPTVVLYAAIACIVSFAVSGRHGIYHAQTRSGFFANPFQRPTL